MSTTPDDRLPAGAAPHDSGLTVHVGSPPASAAPHATTEPSVLRAANDAPLRNSVSLLTVRAQLASNNGRAMMAAAAARRTVRGLLSGRWGIRVSVSIDHHTPVWIIQGLQTRPGQVEVTAGEDRVLNLPDPEIRVLPSDAPRGTSLSLP